MPVHEGLVRLEDRSPKLWLTLENHLRQASLDACSPVSTHKWRLKGLPASPWLTTKATSGRQDLRHGSHVTLHRLCQHKAAVSAVTACCNSLAQAAMITRSNNPCFESHI